MNGRQLWKPHPRFKIIIFFSSSCLLTALHEHHKKRQHSISFPHLIRLTLNVHLPRERKRAISKRKNVKKREKLWTNALWRAQAQKPYNHHNKFQRMNEGESTYKTSQHISCTWYDIASNSFTSRIVCTFLIVRAATNMNSASYFR